VKAAHTADSQPVYIAHTDRTRRHIAAVVAASFVAADIAAVAIVDCIAESADCTVVVAADTDLE
jgi:hypothetical protein